MAIDERPPTDGRTHYTTNTSNVTYTFLVPQYKPKGDAYVASAETPEVYCGFGPTPADALEALAKLLRDEGVESWSASAVNFDTEGTHYITIYL